MASTDPSAILQRLLDDEYVHEHLSEAASGVRDIYRRVRQLPPYRVIEDKTVYDRARDSAVALTAAARRVAGKPPPEPPKRSRLPALLVLLATGAVVFWAARRQKQLAADTAPATTTSPVAREPLAADADADAVR
jgi:hypothetical protein